MPTFSSRYSPVGDISTVRMSRLSTFEFSGTPPLGSLRSMLCCNNGVVITKMISSTKARSSNGVILISLSVTRALRWEKRLINDYSFLQILRFHFGDEFLGEIVQLNGQNAQIMNEPVVTK